MISWHHVYVEAVVIRCMSYAQSVIVASIGAAHAFQSLDLKTVRLNTNTIWTIIWRGAK